MRWEDRGTSSDVEDRRGSRRVGAGLGIGGFLLLLVLSVVFKKDFFTLLGTSGGGGTAPAAQASRSPEEQKLVSFVSFVLDDVQDTWTREFQEAGRRYDRTKLVLFTDAVRSGCGFAEGAMGPFYCPADQRVYIDLGFYQELKTRFGAPGDFAQAYVLAHEIGHHVQELLGTGEQVRRAQQAHPEQANGLSVRLELQADCYAGVWGNSTEQRQLLDPGDVEEGIKAAGAVGDDRIQRMSTGRVNPDGFTHGTSEQRVAWFRRGYESGRADACNTFESSR